MKHCSSCGYSNDLQYALCLGCGAALPQGPTASAHAPRAKALSHVSVRLATACTACAKAIPVNGVHESVTCDNCLATVKVSRLDEQLESNAEGYRWRNGPFATAQHIFEDAQVECPACEAIVDPPGPEQFGAATIWPCTACGHAIPSYPVPDWLREQLPHALHVVGGDPPPELREGLSLEVEQASVEPVLMACPGCGAGLSLGPDAERTTSCKYCQAQVFIPDALWQRLHPARTMRRWTLFYRGDKLESAKALAERLADEAAEKAKRRRKAEARAREAESERAEAIRRSQDKARSAKIRMIVAGVLLVGLALGITAVSLGLLSM
jgi:hypothetical protein